MIWILLVISLFFGISLIVKAKSKPYKIIGYILTVVVFLFLIVVILNIGVGSNEEIIEDDFLIN
ncbi:hypothetical protein [Virgibacillus natechei]|nr:hypothetical protein [Virgibacillus natechei]